MSRVVSIASDLTAAIPWARRHLLSAPLEDAFPTRVSTVSLEFVEAYFYGFKGVQDDGRSRTANTGAVFVGELEGDEAYCVDEVSPGACLVVRAAAGTKLDLANFVFSGANVGDRVFVKYQ